MNRGARRRSDRAYTSPQRPLAGAMGSVQILPSGRVFVGWGVASYTSEFTADGTLLFDVSLPDGTYSYRGLWLDWSGTPHQPPAAVAGPERHDRHTVGVRELERCHERRRLASGGRIEAGRSASGRHRQASRV